MSDLNLNAQTRSAEARVAAMDATSLAAEVTRLVENPEELRRGEPELVAALLKELDFEPRRLPPDLRQRFTAAFAGVTSSSQAGPGSPARVRPVLDPVSVGFRTKVSELMEVSIAQFVRTGQNPWIVFAERLTSHLLHLERASDAQLAPTGAGASPPPARASEITRPRRRPAHLPQRLASDTAASTPRLS